MAIESTVFVIDEKNFFQARSRVTGRIGPTDNRGRRGVDLVGKVIGAVAEARNNLHIIPKGGRCL